MQALEPVPGGLYVDATLGAGGHTEALLSVPDTRVIGIDRDPLALRIATERLARFGKRFVPLKAAFADIEAALAGIGVSHVDGLLADIGVSSMQIDDPERGMSFRAEGPLDMRMDTTSGETALELIDRLDDDELADVLFKLGEERRSRRVARCIKQARDSGELETTLDLRRAVVRAVGPNRVGGVDPATRTFQALRMHVNDELGEAARGLAAALDCLRPGGRLAVISFHSLEDRLVKRFIADHAGRSEGSRRLPAAPAPPARLCPLARVMPGAAELAANPRARSAVLRVAEVPA